MPTTLKQTDRSYWRSLGNSKLHGVPSSHIDDVWDSVKQLVFDGLEYSDGKYTVDDVYKSLKSRNMQLWVSINEGIEAIGITEINIYPNKKVCQIFLVSGRNMDNWLHFSKVIEAWAKERGCQSLECFGRPGWGKVIGWERIHIVLRKKL